MHAQERGNPNINYTMSVLMCLAMVFIVAGHVVVGPGGGLNFAYNLFPTAGYHVTIFIFVSGYFYKSSLEATPALYLKKRIKRLILPLYLFTFVYVVWVAFSRFFGFSIGQDPTLYNIFIDPLLGGHAFEWNLCLWFVFPLFCVQILHFGLCKLIKAGESQAKNIVLAALYFAVGFATVSIMLAVYGPQGFDNFSSSWQVLAARVGFFLPWYGLGRIYRLVLERYDKLNNWAYFGVVIFLQLVVLILNKGHATYLISWCRFTSGHFLPFISSILGIAFWMRFARILAPGLQNDRLMNYFADNTFSVMAHQFVGMMLVKACFALLAAVGVIQGFDMGMFLSNIWYCWTPNALQDVGAQAAFCTIYVVGGIFIPLCIHWAWSKVLPKAMREIAQRN